jgi:hypothetical protein
MRRRVLQGFLVMVSGAICSLAVAGMIAFLLRVLGMPVGWLLSFLSVSAGIALGFTFALPLSEQVLGGGESSRQRRGREPEQ